MKKPSLKVDKDAVVRFLLNHCEKLVVGVIGIVALGLAWGGINALRVKSVQRDKTPEAVATLAANASRHIDAASKPPADMVRKGGQLALAIDPWRPQQVKIATAPETALLDRPLFQELSRRAKPTVFPIEDLRAVAGVAVLPEVADPNAGAMMPGGPGRPGFGPIPDGVVPDGDARAQRPRRGGRRDQETPEIPQPAPEFGGPMGMGGMPRGRVVPYVIVTGLVPVAKQWQEYGRCFGSAGLRDPQIDTPRWNQYIVERAAVGGPNAGRWDKFRPKNVEIFEQGGRMADPGPNPNAPAEAMQQEVLPPTFLLGSAETDIGYVAALPQRIDDAWGRGAIHPWFLPQLKKLLVQAAPGLAGNAAAAAIDPQRLKTAAAELTDEVGIVSGMKFAGDAVPQREAGVVAFDVRTVDGAVGFGVDAVGTSTAPVFVISPAWARTLDFEGGVTKDAACNLRVRIEKIGRTSVARILGIQYIGADGQPGEEVADPNPFPLAAAGAGMGDGPGAGWAEGRGTPGESAGAEYRLFRFVDMNVKPGQTYRYRVRLAVRNPNYDLPQQFLADPAAGKDALLASKESNETPPVAVPEPTSILVRPITKEESKRLKLKPGSQEILVMAPSSETGNFSLRGLITETGGLANVDSGLNKPGDTRARGEDVTTDRVLVDVRGRQEEGAKTAGLPEPLEMLFLKPDGTFELVSAADSQTFYERYAGTLDMGDTPPQGAMPADIPNQNPFDAPPQPRRGAGN